MRLCSVISAFSAFSLHRHSNPYSSGLKVPYLKSSVREQYMKNSRHKQPANSNCTYLGIMHPVLGVHIPIKSSAWCKNDCVQAMLVHLVMAPKQEEQTANQIRQREAKEWSSLPELRAGDSTGKAAGQAQGPAFTPQGPDAERREPPLPSASLCTLVHGTDTHTHTQEGDGLWRRSPPLQTLTTGLLRCVLLFCAYTPCASFTNASLTGITSKKQCM